MEKIFTPGEDYFVPDGNGSYTREHADTESSVDDEDDDEEMESEDGVCRIEEVDDHPLIFLQDDRPGSMFEMIPESNEIRIYRILDPNLDEPATDEEYFLDTVDGYPRWQRFLHGEPESEEIQAGSAVARKSTWEQ